MRLIAVDFPAPFGPSSATISARFDLQVDAIEGGHFAKRLGDSLESHRRGVSRLVPRWLGA